MLLLLLVAMVSLLPMLALFFWMRSGAEKDGIEKTLYDKAFCYGLLCIFPVILVSGTSHVLIRLTGTQTTNPLLYQMLYKFIVLALAEEVVKYAMFRRLLKKTGHSCTHLSAATLMTSVGIGFSILESIIYAIGADVPTMLIRGFSFPHAGYGFLVGYYYGKGIKTGRPSLVWVGFLLAWFMHGLYDFSLSEELLAINDNLVIIPFLLVAIEIALVVVLIRFIRRERKKKLSE